MYKEQQEPTNRKYRLTIDDSLQLSSVKAELNSYFPYLKIEFFKAPHKIGEGSAKTLLYSDTRFIKDCRIRHTNGIYEFTDETTVSSFEEQLLHEYGLSIQVFRRHGNVWLETSATDGWTLKQQNQEGMDLSTYQAS